ncbi:L-fucose mutarotase [Avibacterium avium]|uniref:L-fucose mutarotase n=1 Tax=Avibacterium avium TaxID=751 RepID=UPI003BF78BFF
MLKGIHPALSPELLKVLAEMGHGEEIVLADAHFPAHQVHHRILRADGLGIDTLLAGITPLFEFDSYVDAPLIMMQAVQGDSLDPSVEARYLNAIETALQKSAQTQSAVQNLPKLARIDRFDFYDRAKQAYAVVVTGECAKYGNIILKKGVTPVFP